MEGADYSLRIATEDDAAAIVAIYAPYVHDTAVTFECRVPSAEEYRCRIEAVLARYPFIVACRADGSIVGYCYANAFRNRAAYDWAVECSIYLKPEVCGSGISERLYACLEKILILQRITNMNVCIAVPNLASERFHVKQGFQTVARFTKCGYKLNAWRDMIWMEKLIAEHPDDPQAIIAFPNLEWETVRSTMAS